MLKEITLGQYFPGKSVLHKMDPRMKIILLTFYIVFIFLTKNYISLAIMGISVLGVIILSTVSPKLYFKSVKAIVFIVLFTSALNLFYGTGDPIWQWHFLKITESGINTAVFVAVRIISLVLISSVLTYTTSPTDLTDGIEKLLKPLTVFHIQVHEIAMMMTIALRFIPTLLEETDKIMSAQKARGADFESGNFAARIKALIPILIPLFVSAFRRAFDLAMAMESRCYHGGDGRTRMKVLKYTKYDFAALAVLAVIFIGVIICNIKFPAALRSGM
ncbi:MAG: energy-coupling factor transporter transmembrane protein EcfT [Clostridia bacterium]|nr:energy-coupling factor transporter transmembrane protein EcfT [Clostridia bacterium]